MRINKNIVFLSIILISLSKGEGTNNNLFNILNKDKINHIQINSDNIISMLSGEFSPKKSNISVEDVEKFCTSIQQLLSQQSFKEDFIYEKKQISIIGTNHFRYQQVYRGIPVQGRFLDVHSNIHHQISSLSNDYQIQ